MKKAFPDEWVAVVNYTSNDVGDVDGEVVFHSNDKSELYKTGNMDAKGGTS